MSGFIGRGNFIHVVLRTHQPGQRNDLILARVKRGMVSSWAHPGNTLPGIFSGFQGALDVQARAQARVHIPASVPSRLNLPVHAGGVVLEPAAPGGVTTVLSSNTVVLR